jgi:hypothetical protein
MTPRLLIWLFPFLMVIFEFLLRSGMRDPAAFDFVGPTLGAAALGMMLPLTRVGVLPRMPDPGATDGRRRLEIDARARLLAAPPTLRCGLGWRPGWPAYTSALGAV